MPWRQALDLSSFDPETVEMLAEAVDLAWQRVRDDSKPVPSEDKARLELATYIIERARKGERNRESLVQYALFKAAIKE